MQRGLDRLHPLACWFVLALVASTLSFAGPAAAQAGRDGCYFGECPGGRTPSATTPQVAPPPPPAAPPRAQKQATAEPAPPQGGPLPNGPAPNAPSASAPTPRPPVASASTPAASAPPAPTPPAPKPAPRKPSGPKIGGNFCEVINEVADLATEEFKSIAGKSLSKSTIETTKPLPGADLCAINRKHGEKSYLCIWEVDTKQMAKIVETFVETVNNCFDDSEAEEIEDLTHRITATDEADILVVGDVENKRVIMLITQAEEEEQPK